ncbi:MAG: transposase-like protein [Cellvibrionaceae bacterium]|jgi:transposase-like protein
MPKPTTDLPETEVKPDPMSEKRTRRTFTRDYKLNIIRKADACKHGELGKLFPPDDSARKVIYLAIQNASKKWTMPIRDWKPALNRFMIEFEDRLAGYI